MGDIACCLAITLAPGQGALVEESSQVRIPAYKCNNSLAGKETWPAIGTGNCEAALSPCACYWTTAQVERGCSLETTHAGGGQRREGGGSVTLGMLHGG